MASICSSLVRYIPTVIGSFFPTLYGRELPTPTVCYRVMRFLDQHSDVKLFVDTHTDYNNSTTNIVSRFLLHPLMYKPIAKKLVPYIDRFLCISYEAMIFLNKEYGIPENKLELYPLGGIVLNECEYKVNRDEIRKQLGIGEDTLLLVHSGKMDAKKKTVDLVMAVHSIDYFNLRLAILGSMDDIVNDQVMPIIENDDRILFQGWQDGESLIKYLCAGDLYCQPGTQSATMQVAACSGCALMLYPYESHLKLFENSKVYDIIKRLEEFEIEPIVSDPWADPEIAKHEYGVDLIPLEEVKRADCIIVAVGHKQFRALSMSQIKEFFKSDLVDEEKVLIDVKSLYRMDELKASGMRFWRL